MTSKEMILKQPSRLEGMGLDELISAMCLFGKPRISLLDKGWHCAIDMYVASKGATFTIASEFGCATPISAAYQCAERVVAAINDYAKV